MKSKQYKIASSLVGALVLGATSTQAAIVLDNETGGTLFVGGSSVSGTRARGVFFQAETGMDLTAITVGLAAGGGTATYSPVVSLYSGNGAGTSFSLLGSASPAAVSISQPFTAFSFTFDLTSLPNLVADGYYLLALSGTHSGSSPAWGQMTPNTAPTDTAWADYLGYRTSSDSGTSWANSSPTNYNSIKLEATPVPEPATYAALSGLLLLGFAAIRKQASR
jgi:hypothetical protein